MTTMPITNHACTRRSARPLTVFVLALLGLLLLAGARPVHADNLSLSILNAQGQVQTSLIADTLSWVYSAPKQAAQPSPLDTSTWIFDATKQSWQPSLLLNRFTMQWGSSPANAQTTQILLSRVRIPSAAITVNKSVKGVKQSAVYSFTGLRVYAYQVFADPGAGAIYQVTFTFETLHVKGNLMGYGNEESTDETSGNSASEWDIVTSKP